MSVAPRIEAHLSKVGVSYSLVEHPQTFSSLDSARSAHIPASQVAKAVLTHDGENYRVCVIPASHRLIIPWLNRHMDGNYRLVHEDELADKFEDCSFGAIPALGQVYGFPVIWDKSLTDMQDIYFESGDHKNLVHLSHASFMELMGLQENDVISCSQEEYDQDSHLIH